MKLSVTALTLALSLATTTAAAPTAEPSLANDTAFSTLQKRARWSVTPYPGRDTCDGAGSSIIGSGNQGCTRTGGANANIVISDSCTIILWSDGNCMSQAAVANPGTSACYQGQFVSSISVRC